MLAQGMSMPPDGSMLWYRVTEVRTMRERFFFFIEDDVRGHDSWRKPASKVVQTGTGEI